MYSTDLTPEELLPWPRRSPVSTQARTTNVVAAGSAGSAGRASVVYLQDGAYTTFEDMQDGHLGAG